MAINFLNLLLNLTYSLLTSQIIHIASHWEWAFVITSSLLLIGVVLEKLAVSPLLRDFDIQFEIERERKRRVLMLGDLITTTFKNENEERQAIVKRSRYIQVPFKALYHWYQEYKHNKEVGLTETSWIEIWDKLKIKDKNAALETYYLLGEFADMEYLIQRDTDELSTKNKWSVRTTRSWLRRYREGGIIGLCSGHDPYKRKSKKKDQVSIGSLINEELQVIFERLTMLGDLAEKKHVKNEEVEKRANEVGVSARTLRYWWSNYRRFGLVGLKREERSDKGVSHSISTTIEELIVSVRLSYKNPTINFVHKQVCLRAKVINEPPPTVPKVREIVNEIDEALILLADGRYDEFRNKYRATHSLIIGKNKIIIQLDTTQIDVLVKDLREPKYRSKSGEIRPYLTIAIEANSRVLLSAILTYDVPDRFTVATLIHDAVRTTEEKWYGGYFDELWVDNGKPFIADLIKEIAYELNAVFNQLHPHQPQIKGVCENFFDRLDSKIWQDTEGYVGRNVVERIPNTHAKHDIYIINDKLQNYIKEYNNEEHSELDGSSPLKYWADNLFSDDVPEETLSALLMEREERELLKDGISLKRKKYWDVALGEYTRDRRRKFLIKYGFYYGPPPYIEVFTPKGEWICTATMVKSEEGEKVTPDDIRESQTRQRKSLRAEINEAKAGLKTFDKEHKIQPEKSSSGKNAIPTPLNNPSPSKQPPEAVNLNALKGHQIHDKGG